MKIITKYHKQQLNYYRGDNTEKGVNFLRAYMEGRGGSSPSQVIFENISESPTWNCSETK